MGDRRLHSSANYLRQDHLANTVVVIDDFGLDKPHLLCDLGHRIVQHFK